MRRERDNFFACERRKYPRLEENIFVLYRLKSDASKEFNKAFSKDISCGGLCFETESDIPMGSKLELELYQPIKRSKTVILSIVSLAKVIWTSSIEKNNFEPGENKYKIGIEFLKIKEQDRQEITKYVEELVSTQ